MAEWKCEHGTTFTGSDDFISGARNAHLEIEERMRVRATDDHRSVNDIAQDIVDAAPQAEPLVEEWAAATSAARLREAAAMTDWQGKQS